MRLALCHPDRRHQARGLCRGCYANWAYHRRHPSARYNAYPEARASREDPLAHREHIRAAPICQHAGPGRAAPMACGRCGSQTLHGDTRYVSCLMCEWDAFVVGA